MTVRAGLVLLIVLDGIVGFWQYFFPRSFFTEHFALRDAVGVGTGLGFEAVLTIVLLIVTLRDRSHRIP